MTLPLAASARMIASGSIYAGVNAVIKTGKNKMAGRATIDGTAALILLPGMLLALLHEQATTAQIAGLAIVAGGILILSIGRHLSRKALGWAGRRSAAAAPQPIRWWRTRMALEPYPSWRASSSKP